MSRLAGYGKLVVEATTSNNESATLYDEGRAWYACVALAFLIDVRKCKIYYCSGDLCNGGKVPMISAIMFFACALVAFLR